MAPSALKGAWEATQQLLRQRKISAGHDISDGGLATTLLEMSFSGNTGISVRCCANSPFHALCWKAEHMLKDSVWLIYCLASYRVGITDSNGLAVGPCGSLHKINMCENGMALGPCASLHITTICEKGSAASVCTSQNSCHVCHVGRHPSGRQQSTWRLQRSICRGAGSCARGGSQGCGGCPVSL